MSLKTTAKTIQSPMASLFMYARAASALPIKLHIMQFYAYPYYIFLSFTDSKLSVLYQRHGVHFIRDNLSI